MNVLRDVRVVLAKEWLELRSSDTRWVGLTTLAAFVIIVGVLVPWQFGAAWIRAPWSVAIWAWIPLFIVTTVTSDVVAGERERRTLETLLSTRLSDAAILWGKWLACVLWVWSAMVLCLPASWLTVNLSQPGGLILPGASQALATAAVSFAGAGLGAAIGVLVSLRAESVRHAQQVLAIGALVFAFIPLALLRILPTSWTVEVFSAFAYGSPARVAWWVAGVLALLTLPLIALAQTRFRRGAIPLK